MKSPHLARSVLGDWEMERWARIPCSSLRIFVRSSRCYQIILKRLKTFHDQTEPLVDYYRPIGKLRCVNSNQEPEAVYAEARNYFLKRFVYLVGTEGMLLSEAVSSGGDSGWAHIDAREIYKKFVADEPIGKEKEVAGCGG